MKKIFTISLLLVSFTLFGKGNGNYIQKATADKAIAQLESRYGKNDRIVRGVNYTAQIWFEENGTQDEFVDFVVKHYVADEDSLYNLAVDLSGRMSLIEGYAWRASREFGFPLDVDTGEITPVEALFGNYSNNANVQKGYYDSKVAFLVSLNYPRYTEEEKVQLGEKWSNVQWGYALMGDKFNRGGEEDESEADKEAREKARKEFDAKMQLIPGNSQQYANNSTVELSAICDRNGDPLFEDDIQLLFHWKMRDEIKMLFDTDDPKKLEKQQAIYQAMVRFIDQTIPAQLIQGKGYKWNPYTNELKKDGKVIPAESTEDKRYGYIRNLFIKKYRNEPDSAAYFNNYFKRYGVDAEEAEDMYVKVLSSPQAREVGKMMKKKLGRRLQPFDTWFTGFNNRSNFETSELDAKMKAKYPTPEALQADIPNILQKLGFSAEKARFFGEKIQVDRARANGHCMGAAMEGQKAHIRTNFREDGLDFGGYQTFMHELGHAVQMTIATYTIELSSMRGLPNSGVVESAAVLFEFRTWASLLKESDPDVENNLVLDNFWGTFEICGPALWELRMWQWMYHNKTFTTQELKENSIAIAKGIWNEFFAPVFGEKDHVMEAVYNHTLNASLYLSSYALAHMIQIQIEDYIAGKDYQSEVERIYSQGNKDSKVWMQRAVGAPLSADPILRYTQRAIDALKK